MRFSRMRLSLIYFYIILCTFANLYAHSENEPTNCYALYHDIAINLQRQNTDQVPYVLYANGSKVAISKAFEKEGLLYSDIAPWFDYMEPKVFYEKLAARLELESQGKHHRILTNILQNWAEYHRAPEISLNDIPKNLTTNNKKFKAKNVLDYLIAQYENPLDAIKMETKNELFYRNILSFEDLRSSDHTPRFLSVGDDLGSYEVRSRGGTVNQREFYAEKNLVQEKLEGRVGHQHIVHDWPNDHEARLKIAPKYIEMMDATTWYLFWRQMKRNPDDVESILTHPFLGVYTRSSLNRQYKAMVNGDIPSFNDQHRMIAARNFPGNPEFPGQKNRQVPDFEVRSGNKGAKSAFVEDTLTARIASGDYTGLQKFNSYEFDPSTPTRELVENLSTKENPISDHDIQILEQFEKDFPLIRWSDHALAQNHVRNKIMSPLLPWEQRLPLGNKVNNLKKAQRKYYDDLVIIAKDYLDFIAKNPKLSLHTIKFQNEKKLIIDNLEYNIYKFSKKMRLDYDFEHYLYPRPTKLPSIFVENKSDFDVNKIPLGIEYSFRFPAQPGNAEVAEKEIQTAANAVQNAVGGKSLELQRNAGHGHNLSIRFKTKDEQGQTWRIEWDGVQRSYKNGKPYWARHGHVEIPTPKFIPDMQVIEKIYQSMCNINSYPSRLAGGAHMNVDLEALKKMPPQIGARKMANLISYFESNQEMISFLWQHPLRMHAAQPIQITKELAYHLNHFQGDWQDLGKILYEQRYFNTLQKRKPKYSQLNVTSLMSEEIPEEYQKGIDIRNTKTHWFPSFGKLPKDRIEFRLFDAPEDEYIAALQIKYTRALLNKAFNAEKPILLEKHYTSQSKEAWKENHALFIKDAEEHFKDLGLDPQEFSPLIRQAMENQEYKQRPKNLKPSKQFKKIIEEEEEEDFWSQEDFEFTKAFDD